ncbi:MULTISPECIES: DUF6453 family protein [unclassified Erwinia]|uniref:DUF6453 family protein n=1 Tax=unclassified Erwinia TaxID=2622719 RepID=UPI0011779F11|nr:MULTISPECIES: DUF6453 family protein [unclassified Erwinia]
MQIAPDDNGKPIDISSNTKAAAYRGYYAPQLDGNGRQTFSVPLSDGAQLFVIPRTACTSYYTPAAGVPRVLALDGVWVSGNTVTSTVRNFNQYYDPGHVPAGFDAFQIMGSSNVSGYGLFMQSSTDFSAITDAAIVSQCVWRGTVNINGSWSIPDIPDRNNCIVFAHWDRSDRVIYFDRNNMRIEAYSDGGETNPADCYMEVIIFTNGTPPVPPAWGVAIWNASGQCTFSSRKAPMIWNGNYVTFNGTPWSYSSPATGVNRAAIPLCGVGADTGDSVLSDGYRALYNAGIRMSGNAVCGSRAQNTGITYSQNSGLIRSIASVTLPVIDASIYL